jgi:hypothetical protein
VRQGTGRGRPSRLADLGRWTEDELEKTFLIGFGRQATLSHAEAIIDSYFALRDAAGTFHGTLEVTQDITLLRALEGVKRFLDER